MLRACVDGVPWDGPTDLPQGVGRRIALFPQEWYRDPESALLASLPSDAPWHDPQLFESVLTSTQAPSQTVSLSTSLRTQTLFTRSWQASHAG